ncbi:MFS transporter [Morganella psychrotolerans]|uniref:MFS transporter n=1 Tax=Morganella psychrotolerans TaxID=368603 RepID=A0A1B8H7D5_9GAMM|nr:MFS transporter [Morganella psychrotolerans]OBU04979.1 MFS transporter [Morganella psychrotolerans]
MNQQQRIVLFVLVLAGFVTIFDLFVVNVAIVSIERDLHTSFTELTLIIVGYELAFGLLLITGGRLGDIYGRRCLYRVGMTCFTVASLLCAFAPTATLLVTARFIQGLAAALLFPQVYAGIRLNFDETQAKKAFGYLGMTLGLAAIAGQALGGWLITLDLFGMGWRLIFLVNLPVGILALILSRYLQEGRAEGRLTPDWFGVLLSAAAVSMLLLPLLMLPVWGWDLRSSGLFISGIILLWCFVRHEMNLSRAGRTPLFDMAILRNGKFVTGTGVVVCVYATSSAFPLVLSLLLQNVMGATPLEAGLIFVPSSIGFVIASFIMPRAIIKRGERVIFRGALWYAAGYLALIAGLYLLPAGETPWLLTPLLFWIGFTQAMIMTPMLNLVLSRVSAPETGMASGLTATLQQIGAAAGATAVSVILQFSLRSADTPALTSDPVSAFSLSLGFNILMALCAAWFLYRLTRKSCVSGE